MSSNSYEQAEGITWISTRSLIHLRHNASRLSLNKSKIHAKQGGAYLSSFKGRGMEFDESRIYQAGDDIRNMDWRVTARTGTAHTKVFREERERPILLWLDLNPSMMFATRNCYKSVIACELATLIAWSAANNNDRVGGLIFSADEHIELKPQRGKMAVLNFIGRATKHGAWKNRLGEKVARHNNKNSHSRNMAAAVSRLRKVTHPGSLIFMISDFREMDDAARSHLASIARHNDIVLIKITDPIEKDLPSSGSYKLSDGENELQINTANRRTREEYSQRFMTQDKQLKKLCRKNRMYIINISTEDDFIDKLITGIGIRSGHKTQFRTAR